MVVVLGDDFNERQIQRGKRKIDGGAHDGAGRDGSWVGEAGGRGNRRRGTQRSERRKARSGKMPSSPRRTRHPARRIRPRRISGTPSRAPQRSVAAAGSKGGGELIRGGAPDRAESERVG